MHEWITRPNRAASHSLGYTRCCAVPLVAVWFGWLLSGFVAMCGYGAFLAETRWRGKPQAAPATGREPLVETNLLSESADRAAGQNH